MLLATLLFFGSLVAIAALFVFKYWELRTERAASTIRDRADEQALRLKQMLTHMREESEKLPPQLVRFARLGIHELALGVAGMARLLERQAHRLADMVSHKHRFERRESNNDYLKQVTDHKNGLPGQGNGSILEEKNDL